MSSEIALLYGTAAGFDFALKVDCFDEDSLIVRISKPGASGPNMDFPNGEGFQWTGSSSGHLQMIIPRELWDAMRAVELPPAQGWGKS